MKDWAIYIEDDKIKAYDLTNEDRKEIDNLLNGLGFKIIGYVGFRKKKDAITYATVVLT